MIDTLKGYELVRFFNWLQHGKVEYNEVDAATQQLLVKLFQEEVPYADIKKLLEPLNEPVVLRQYFLFYAFPKEEMIQILKSFDPLSNAYQVARGKDGIYMSLNIYSDGQIAVAKVEGDILPDQIYL